MFKVVDFTYQIKGVQILKKMNLTFNSSCFNVIIGQNGSGKSTLIKCLTGLYPCHKNAIYFDDKTLSSYSFTELANKRALLMQNNHCSERLTVIQVIKLSEIHNNESNLLYLNELIQYFGLDTFLNREINQLSGGEQQKVHFVRVLYQLGKENLKEKVLFLDEPVSAADIKNQYSFLNFANMLVKKHQLTVIAVLHDLNLTAHFADYILALKEGEIVFYKPIEEAIQSPYLYKVYDTEFDILRTNESNILVSPKNNFINN